MTFSGHDDSTINIILGLLLLLLRPPSSQDLRPWCTRPTVDDEQGATFRHAGGTDGANGERSCVLEEYFRHDELALLVEMSYLEISRWLDLDAFAIPVHFRRGKSRVLHFHSAAQTTR